jgi:protein-disulfide isomerase
MSKKQPSVSKRQAMREERQRKQRTRRWMMIGGVTIAALVLVGLLVLPSIQQAAAPVGNIVQITPRSLPNPQGTALGDPSAPVKVVVYEDFQCPVCRNYTETIEPQIIQNDVVTGKVYYQFKQFPFIDTNSTTKESHQAANASMCAADQGKFWEYHDMLFVNWNGENQGSFSNKRLAAFAQDLGLNMNEFNTCFQNNTFKDQINKDYAEGVAAGVTGTPSIFVDGKIVQPSPNTVPSYSDIQKAIDAAMPK